MTLLFFLIRHIRASPQQTESSGVKPIGYFPRIELRANKPSRRNQQRTLPSIDTLRIPEVPQNRRSSSVKKRVTPNIAPFFHIQREFDRNRQDFAAGNRLFKNQNRSKPPVLSASNTRISAERSKNHTSWKGHEYLGLQKYRYLINK